MTIQNLRNNLTKQKAEIKQEGNAGRGSRVRVRRDPRVPDDIWRKLTEIING